jgi:hypothetical protein
MPLPAQAKTPPVRFTGLFWPCGTGPAIHPERRLALTIKVGKKAGDKFVRCPTCDNMYFLGPRWQDNMGLTQAQATAQGFICI